MIIPPDPEKDPNIFSPSSSTPSLLIAPSESSFDVAWNDDEFLPPYERRQRRSRASSHDADTVDEHSTPRRTSSSPPQSSGFVTSNLQHLPLPHLPHTSSTSTGSLTPTQTGPSSGLSQFNTQTPSPSTTIAAPLPTSRSKLWEGSSSQSGGKDLTKRRNRALILPVGVQKWWKRWRRWVQAIVVLILIGIALLVGLLVGTRQAAAKHSALPKTPGDKSGRKTAIWGIGASANMTYDEDRDGPLPADGYLTSCTSLTDLNLTASPFSSLFTPFPASTISLASFSLPLTNGTSPTGMFINARGLGSSGTVTFIGSDASEQLTTSGQEGHILVDVVVRYAGFQDLSTIMRVCQMARGDGGVGVGVYTPQETDGKVANPYSINPAYIPTSHIIIRLPPSAYQASSPPIYFPSLELNLDRMEVRFGDTTSAAEFGSLGIETGRGGMNAGYIAAKNAAIIAADNPVRGRWNVSEALWINVTDGYIAADVILYDPSTPDYTAAVNPAAEFGNLRRSPHFPSALSPALAEVSESLVSNTSRHIVTGFYTTEGTIDVQYLRQPPSVSITALIATLQGTVGVRMHPNYVGPFIAKTIWGEAWIPTPNVMPDQDPQGKKRNRELAFGVIEVDPMSKFASVGVNATTLVNSSDTISGAAYWANVSSKGKVGYKSVEDVQGGIEGRGNELVVLGAWGDVELTFDGA
ncbi:hypothetical protein IAR55_004209 [Kwoniella newhampshirensis]|uniref:Uncharacterized protein n=1 Tax=Kwoniella newhampshirensis TaxID=1651941 RepID=A0AAW0YYZ9_9TREE